LLIFYFKERSRRHGCAKESNNLRIWRIVEIGWFEALKPLETTLIDTVLIYRTTFYFIVFVFVLRQCSQK